MFKKNIMSRVKFIAVCGLIVFSMINIAAQTSLNWAHASQGSGESQISVRKMMTDSSGNIYTYGYFSGSILLDPVNQTGQINTTGDYNYDLFLCKWDSAGNFLSSFTLAGNTNDTPTDLAIDQEGNLWLGGYFFGVMDLDPGSEEYLITSIGESDLFLAKYNTEGALLWAGQFGSLYVESGGLIAIDNSGRIHFGGNFNGTIDLDPGPGIYEVEANDTDGYDGFICTLDSEGNFIEAGQFEGPGYVFISELKIDAEGNLWCGGSFDETADFNPGEDVFMLGSPGYHNCFLVKLDPDGNFITALCYGGGEVISMENFVFNSQGSLLITGYYRNSADFDPGPEGYILNAVGINDCYVLSLDSDGMFNWAASVGGESNDSGQDIAVDGYDNVYVSGYFYGIIDADPGAGSYLMQSAGNTDGFMLKLDEGGNFVWAKQLASNSGIYGNCLILLEDGSIIESGSFFYMADFDPAEPIFVLWASGFYDIFIRKLDNDLTVGIPEIVKSDFLQIYPNPNQGIIFVDVSVPTVCRIFDASGRLVFKSNLFTGINQLDLCDLKHGLYLVQTISSDQVLMRKVLIR